MYSEAVWELVEIVDLGVKPPLIDDATTWVTVDGQRVQDAVKEYIARDRS
ncbi:MAG: hypothetical protein V8S72_01220 [Oscillospiraceae bacterium]